MCDILEIEALGDDSADVDDQNTVCVSRGEFQCFIVSCKKKFNSQQTPKNKSMKTDSEVKNLHTSLVAQEQTNGPFFEGFFDRHSCLPSR